MVSAVIEEDNYEVSLRINFVSAEHEKNKVGCYVSPLFYTRCPYILYCIHLAYDFIQSKVQIVHIDKSDKISTVEDQGSEVHHSTVIRVKLLAT